MEPHKVGKNIPREDFLGSHFNELTQLERKEDATVLGNESFMGSKSNGKDILEGLSKGDLTERDRSSVGFYRERMGPFKKTKQTRHCRPNVLNKGLDAEGYISGLVWTGKSVNGPKCAEVGSSLLAQDAKAQVQIARATIVVFPDPPSIFVPDKNVSANEILTSFGLREGITAHFNPTFEGLKKDLGVDSFGAKGQAIGGKIVIGRVGQKFNNPLRGQITSACLNLGLVEPKQTLLLQSWVFSALTESKRLDILEVPWMAIGDFNTILSPSEKSDQEDEETIRRKKGETFGLLAAVQGGAGAGDRRLVRWPSAGLLAGFWRRGEVEREF
ncbi:hypothetical protein Gotur_023475 [Gossypium turneri]